MRQNNSSFCIVVMGVSGCGKSTVGLHLAKQLQVSFIDGDDFHPPENIQRMSNGIALTDDDRLPWLRSINEFIVSGQPASPYSVIACSALKRSYRDVLARAASVLFVHLVGSFDLIEARSKARSGHFMNVSLLKSQFDILENPEADEAFVAVGIDAPLNDVVLNCAAAVRAHAMFPQ